MNSLKLTVIIKDTNNQLTKDAQVSINPGNINGKTDDNGQVVLSLPNEKKVTVKVNYNDITQEVPYYINEKETNRLEINLAYFQQIKTQPTKEIPQAIPKQNNSVLNIGIILLIIATITAIFYSIKKSIF